MTATTPLAAALVGAAGLLVAACHPATPGADPHDMSASQHSHHAAEHQDEAALHTAEYDPRLGELRERCTGSAQNETDICWTSFVNPTAKHLEDAARHRQMAADHRGASEALRRAEAESCVGVADIDREMSPFRHAEDVLAVEPLPEGARIEIGTVRGLDADKLERVVRCHLARNAVLGSHMPGMDYCPLGVPGAEASVSASDGGLSVTVRSANAESSAEIAKRAQALAAH